MTLFFAILFILAAGMAGYLFWENGRIRIILSSLQDFSTENQNLQTQIQQKNLEINQINEKVEKFLKLFEQNESNWEKKDKNYQNQIYELVEKQSAEIKKARADSCETQKSVIRGKISEEISVLLPDWKWKIGDCRFYSAPVDFCIFSGLSEDNITDIIFVDVKTGAAQLTSRQKQIKKAIESGRVSFDTFRIAEKVVVESI